MSSAAFFALFQGNTAAGLAHGADKRRITGSQQAAQQASLPDWRCCRSFYFPNRHPQSRG
jgi:hypothetical protein